MVDLSERGDMPTQFELDLIANADTSRITDATGQWLLLAQRIGLHAVLAVLDEFGREKVFVPSRKGFIGAVYTPIRNDLLCARAASGAPLQKLRAEFGLSNSHIMRIRSRTGADRDKPHPVHRRR